jgi:hypothetical protein
MNAITFDTLKFVRRLKEAGVPEKHAEAKAEALSEIFGLHAKNLATKINPSQAEIQAVKFELKADMREMDARINGRLNLLTWMLALVIITTVVPALKTLFG